MTKSKEQSFRDLKTNLTAANINYLQQLRDSIYILITNGDPTELYQLHQPSGTIGVVKKSAIVQAIGPAVTNIQGRQIVNWPILSAVSVYRPDIKRAFFINAGTMYFNTYVPPLFLEDTYWDIKDITDVTDTLSAEQARSPITKESLELIPKVYIEFFSHLTSYEQDSLEYFLDWLTLALSAPNRNLTTLVLIGAQGTGKGVLFEHVLKPLFGSRNARNVRGSDLLNTRFNNSMYNQQLLMIDEVQLTEEEALNRFKILANPEIEIEQKGKDSFTARNWLNTIITSNNLNSIYIETTDRRFSVIQLTDVRLDSVVNKMGYEDVESLCADLSKEANVQVLYEWLQTKKPNRNMNYPFKAVKKLLEIKEASYKNWELYLIELFNSMQEGSEMWVEDIQDAILRNVPSIRNAPGRDLLIEFCKKQDGALVFKKPKNTKGYITVKKAIETVDKYDTEMPKTLKVRTTLNGKLGVVK